MLSLRFEVGFCPVAAPIKKPITTSSGTLDFENCKHYITAGDSQYTVIPTEDPVGAGSY